MKNKNGFTIAGFAIVVAVVGMFAVIFGSIAITKRDWRFQEFGRNIGSPIVGQVYLVTAVDTEMDLVIAMPYKIAGDKDGVKTDRRILLKVTNKAINEKNIWFVKSDDGIENIISSPFLKFVSTQKIEVPEKVEYDGL
jgi:hypothetical protein